MNPKAFVRSAAMATLMATLSVGSALGADDDLLELTIALGVNDATFNPTTASVFKLADEYGFYEKHGLHVNIVTLDGTPQAVAALNSGAVDAADISIDAAVRLQAMNDLEIRGIVAVATGSPFLIASKTDINSIEELEGRSYAIADNGSLDHALTQAVLRSFGVSSDLPDYVAIGAPSVRVQALAIGRVDATAVSFGTYASIDGTEGVHILVEADEFSSRAPALSKFIAVLADTVDSKEEELQRFTTALIDASRTFQADPERWIEIAVAARPDLSRENIERTSNFIAERWCINGCMNPEKIQGSVDFVYSNPDFEGVPVVAGSEITDLRFTTNALEMLGVVSEGGLDARP